MTVGKEVVETNALLGSEDETDGVRLLQAFVEVEETLAQAVETGVERLVLATGKDVGPVRTDADAVEEETAGKAVFGIGNEGEHLAGAYR